MKQISTTNALFAMSCSLSNLQNHSSLTVDTFAVENVVIVCLTPAKQSVPRAANLTCSTMHDTINIFNE